MYTITWVPRRNRKPKKWARWYVLNSKGERIAYYQVLEDAIDHVCIVSTGMGVEY